MNRVRQYVEGDDAPSLRALTLRLDDETYEHLRQEAFDRRTTITRLIRDAINQQREPLTDQERMAISHVVHQNYYMPDVFAVVERVKHGQSQS